MKTQYIAIGNVDYIAFAGQIYRKIYYSQSNQKKTIHKWNYPPNKRSLLSNPKDWYVIAVRRM